MEAAVCVDFGLWHYIDFLVLTREKEPSTYTRKQILKTLNDQVGMSDSDVKAMTQGKLSECWGEDKYL